MPFVPEELHGSLIIMGMIFWSGPPEQGPEIVAPFRALATPLADFVRPMRYPEMFPPEEPPAEGAPHYIPSSRILFMNQVDREVAQSIVDTIATAPSNMGVAQIRVLGGEMARVPADATAFAHRSAPIMTAVAGLTFDPAMREANERWADGFMASLDQGVPGRIRQLPQRRGSGAGPRRVPRRDVVAPRPDQAPLRPDEPLPPQPERAARHGLTGGGRGGEWAPGGRHGSLSRSPVRLIAR